MEDLLSQRIEKRKPNFMTGLGHVLRVAGGGKPEEIYKDEDDTAYLDQLLKRQRLQTESPEFQEKLAQTKSNITMEQALQLDRIKYEAQNQRDADELKQKQESYRSAVGQPAQARGPQMPSPGSTLTQQSPGAPSMPSGSISKPGNVPRIQDPPTQEWDEKLQMFVEKPGSYSDNPNFLTDKDIELRERQQEMAKQSGLKQLQSIRKAKEGSKYFGELGWLPSAVAPSSFVPIKNPLMPFGFDRGEYGDRKTWEAALKNLLSEKVIEVMTQMKQASQTGATGFGQLSNRELGVLQSASTALNSGLPPEEAMAYLNQMEAVQAKALGLEYDQSIIDAINSADITAGYPNKNQSGGQQIGRFTYLGEE
jgi:hypothetical protein